MAGPSFFDDPRTGRCRRARCPVPSRGCRRSTETTDLRLAVAVARGTGATAIKIYADLTAEAVVAITAEAHGQGLRVWAHGAVFPASPTEVVTAGADVVSHVTLLAYQASAALGPPRTSTSRRSTLSAFAHGTHPVLDDLLAEMRRRGTILDATACLWTWWRRAPTVTEECP